MAKPIPSDVLVNLNFPFRLDHRGQLLTVDYPAHVLQMMTQALLTARGERVNLPNFGSGLLERVFEGNDNALVFGTRTDVISSLQEGLSGAAVVHDVVVKAAESSLTITITYALAGSDDRQTVTLDL